jgi:putative ATP-dependent endonuclease of OLD family
MKIVRVEIENWRSVKYVQFDPSDITVLVGANNAGKTNILSAINYLIGDRWPIPGNLLDSDYYLGDRDREIHIKIDFEDAPYSRLDFHTERTQYTLQAYDLRGGVVRGFNNEERSRLTFAYVDAARSYERQFSTSRFALFGQAIGLLHNYLRYSGDEKMPQLRRVLSEAHDLLKTDLYQGFESALREAFTAQLKTSGYDVQFEFRTLDETNLYRNLFPTIIERGEPKAPSEVGSGVRNLLVLALFQAFAKAFKGNAILGIEEPELFLHPHAQRSLMSQFEELATLGNQIFISTHNVTFLDVTRPERIVVVECCPDDEEEVCTQIRTTSAEKLLEARQSLHPERRMNIPSIRAFLRNIRSAETAEPYFSRLTVIAEGPSEREALPLLCAASGLNFDDNGVSIIAAGGKPAIDMLVQVYNGHKIPLYVIFDNDESSKPSDRKHNQVLCRLLSISPESDLPAPEIAVTHAVLKGDWESQMQADLEAVQPGLYENLVTEALTTLGLEPGKNKPLIARFVAESLVDRGIIPSFVQAITPRLCAMLELPEPQAEADKAPTERNLDLDDEIPF